MGERVSEAAAAAAWDHLHVTPWEQAPAWVRAEWEEAWMDGMTVFLAALHTVRAGVAVPA